MHMITHKSIVFRGRAIVLPVFVYNLEKKSQHLVNFMYEHRARTKAPYNKKKEMEKSLNVPRPLVRGDFIRFSVKP